VPEGSFDTVVLNSVVQYFPDIEYLVTVVQEAMRLLSPGGRIFIGDVRDLSLLRMFHSAVQLGKAAATVSAGQLKRRVERAVAQEKELVIDPQFFEQLAARMPGISAAQVCVKRGNALNELTRYRYDVVLHTDERIRAHEVCEPLQWDCLRGMAELEAALRQRSWSAVRVNGIPNARLEREMAAQRLIETSDERVEAGVLRRQLSELEGEGVDPERVWALGAEHGYEVRVMPGEGGHFAVELLDAQRADQIVHAVPQTVAVKSWSAYANDPMESSFRQQLIPQLREYMKGRVPEHLVPSAWVALKALPLTPNGKVDRRALPAPQSRPEEMGEYVAPRTELERTLGQIWAQVLRVDQVGLQDNFFELGGHSLLATQVVARIGSALSIEVPTRLIFKFPTIGQLAPRVDELRQAWLLDELATDSDDIKGLLRSVASMSEGRVKELMRELKMEGRS
jgi:acyl carrier protein